MPFTVDGLIVVASVCLVELGGRIRENEQPAVPAPIAPAVGPAAAAAPAEPATPAQLVLRPHGGPLVR